jgi:hypothetical protein
LCLRDAHIGQLFRCLGFLDLAHEPILVGESAAFFDNQFPRIQRRKQVAFLHLGADLHFYLVEKAIERRRDERRLFGPKRKWSVNSIGDSAEDEPR